MKSSAYTSDTFLSHPVYEPRHSLAEHLRSVAIKSKWLAEQSKFQNHNIAFYAGLLHDLGKLNPYYQIAFKENNKRDVEKKMNELKDTYADIHSPFSSWIADNLLQTKINYHQIQKIITLIQYHHSSLKNSIRFNEYNKLQESKKAIYQHLKEFHKTIQPYGEFKKLNWQFLNDDNFLSDAINFDFKLGNQNTDFAEFVELSYFFSCLLQADLGSFEDWSVQRYDLVSNTEVLVKPGPLSDLRAKFNKSAQEDYDHIQGVSIIEAPTGIGKTRAFLELAEKLVQQKKLERIYYFSPLLALTEDFESKIKGDNENKPIFDECYHDDILIYNHIFAGSLQDKDDESSESHSNQKSWFDYESFNKKFVITTTKRFLMTIYSNKRMAKLKLASFRNSVLILDEIQTIPKHILSNLVEIMKILHEKLGIWFLLVSATVPYELRQLHRISISDDLIKSYKQKTCKKIEYRKGMLEVSYVFPGRTLVMQNTRAKAIRTFCNISSTLNKVFYISSGIRKIDREKIITKLKSKTENDFVLVSTQVVEAGVDISFSHVFREQAPLDNIVQMLGRLDREGNAKDQATMVVFEDNGNNIPYSHLEYQKSSEILPSITNSKELLDHLPNYYKEIFNENLKNKNDCENLYAGIKTLDFQGVWEQVGKFIDLDDQRDTIFIPPKNLWDEFKRAFMKDKIPKEDINRFSKYGANLPKPLHSFKELVPFGNDWLDEDLFVKQILLPKKNFLDKIYDFDEDSLIGSGLDRWIRPIVKQ